MNSILRSIGYCLWLAIAIISVTAGSAHAQLCHGCTAGYIPGNSIGAPGYYVEITLAGPLGDYSGICEPAADGSGQCSPKMCNFDLNVAWTIDSGYPCAKGRWDTQQTQPPPAGPVRPHDTGTYCQSGSNVHTQGVPCGGTVDIHGYLSTAVSHITLSCTECTH